jgi:hypothetical protein
LVGLNLCRSRHLRTRDGVGMPHARSGGDALTTSHMSPILSPKYDMDAYMATLFGGEVWDLY